jgi:hypothetical protein
MIQPQHANQNRHWFGTWNVCGVVNGSLHRRHGPAIEFRDGRKDWFWRGLRHRDGGPAMEYSDGARLWYRFGTLITTRGAHRDQGTV